MSETEQGGSEVRCCVICGAVITEGTTQMHNNWHDRLNNEMKSASLGMGFGAALGLSKERL